MGKKNKLRETRRRHAVRNVCAVLQAHSKRSTRPRAADCYSDISPEWRSRVEACRAFALRAPSEEWEKFWSRRPPPGSNDLMALVKRRVLKTEGDLQIFMANLRYFKEALAKLRAGASA